MKTKGHSEGYFEGQSERANPRVPLDRGHERSFFDTFYSVTFSAIHRTPRSVFFRYVFIIEYGCVCVDFNDFLPVFLLVAGSCSDSAIVFLCFLGASHLDLVIYLFGNTLGIIGRGVKNLLDFLTIIKLLGQL